jgi:hypothetical protein
MIYAVISNVMAGDLLLSCAVDVVYQHKEELLFNAQGEKRVA